MPGPVRLLILLVLLVLAPRGPARALAAAGTPVALVVRSDDPGFAWARVQEALAHQLGAAVEQAGAGGKPRGTITMSFRPSRQELAVAYEVPGRGAVSRVVPAPTSVDEAVSTAVALATNLVRDEAEELLGREPVPPPPPAAASPPVATPGPVAAAFAAAAPPRASLAAVALFYPLASNPTTPDLRVMLGLSLLYGRVGPLDGLQLGLGANRADGPVSGAQVAIGFNVAGESVSGFQASFGMNHAGGPVSGFQASLVYNGSAAGVRGTQLTLGVNRANGPVDGVQAAGLLNLAGDVRGLQLGLINVAAHVRGMQLGLINVADDVEGIPLGLISVTESGGVHPVFWASTQTQANVGIKFSTRYTYTLLSGSARRQTDRDLFGPGLAFGGRVPFLPGYFESDLGASYLFGGPLCCLSERDGIAGDLLMGRLRVLIGVEIYRQFSLFAGAAMTVRARFHQPPDRTTEAALGPEIFAGAQL
jgi:hypothetical protein